MAAPVVNEIEEIFEKMSYGPAPETDNVAQVRYSTGYVMCKPCEQSSVFYHD